MSNPRSDQLLAAAARDLAIRGQEELAAEVIRLRERVEELETRLENLSDKVWETEWD
jgi:ubiquinone biosynthesis protein UbiJ